MTKTNLVTVQSASPRRESPLIFVGPARLKRLAEDYRVQVDASAVFAQLHCRWSKLQTKKRSLALAQRFWGARISDKTVFFGSSVDMTISELKEVFGSLDSIPTGAVRSVV